MKGYCQQNSSQQNITSDVEINQAMIEGLVDIGASMSVMAISVVKELGKMHLVVGHETYKMTSGIVTQALRRIAKLLVEVGGIICQMIFLMVDTSSYDLLLGLDFFMKIKAIVDVEKGVIGSQRTLNGNESTTTKCSEYATGA
jgi:predicted aspartyl protease